MKKIKVDNSGLVSVFNDKTYKLEPVAKLSVVDTNGVLIMDPKVKQGYNEYSNVALQNEFMTLMPVIRNFEANRKMFALQNQLLTSTIEKLGQA